MPNSCSASWAKPVSAGGGGDVWPQADIWLNLTLLHEQCDRVRESFKIMKSHCEKGKYASTRIHSVSQRGRFCPHRVSLALHTFFIAQLCPPVWLHCYTEQYPPICFTILILKMGQTHLTFSTMDSSLKTVDTKSVPQMLSPTRQQILNINDHLPMGITSFHIIMTH